MVIDRRKKGCLNPGCDKCLNQIKYEPTIRYCPMCGHRLSYVCCKCHHEIEDLGPDHRICGNCIKKKQDQKDNRKSFVNNKIIKAMADGGAAVFDTVVKKNGKKVVKVVQKKLKDRKGNRV